MTHPNPAFAWDDEAAMRRFVASRGFATLALATADGPMVAHLPVAVTATGRLRFHVARANRVARHLDGAPCVASVVDADHYVSPDWYGLADQVPTWNYLAVEVEGRLAAIDEAAMVAQIDAVSDRFEAALAPKPVWTRAKMAPARFAAMLPAIRGYELTPEAWRGTAKLSQNKTATVREGVATALRAAGQAREAALVERGAPA